MLAYNLLGVPSATSEADNIIKRPPSSLYFQDFSEIPVVIGPGGYSQVIVESLGGPSGKPEYKVPQKGSVEGVIQKS